MMKFACFGSCDSSRRRNLIIDLDGSLVVPHYKTVPRAACRMLRLAWERRWEELLLRLETTPNEAFAKTEHSGQTALHLATFNEGCPMEVAKAMLRCNRHATLVEDRNCYTPLHNLGLFGGDEAVSLFCDTAVMVEQELQGRGKLPTLSRTSPLYLAAKRNAPISTIRILLQTRTRSKWIAPFTGGEAYWDPQQTLDFCSSPLEILLRGKSSCFVGISAETKQQMAEMALELGMEKCIPATDQACIARDPHDQTALDMWAKCLLLLKENVRTSATQQSRSVLHTVASLKVPLPALLQIAVDVFPDQLAQRDDTGNHPLSHVLKSNHPYATKQLISILLPPARMNSSPCNYPLHLIHEGVQLGLEIGLTWEGGLKDIVMANSEVLVREDRKNGLVPALQAASLDVEIGIIFLLLQREPCIMQDRIV